MGNIGNNELDIEEESQVDSKGEDSHRTEPLSGEKPWHVPGTEGRQRG